MARKLALLITAGAAALGIVALGVGGAALSQNKMTPSASNGLTPPQLITLPVSPSLPNAGQVERGRYMVAAGDCVSCHTRDDGPTLAGGLGMNTPFGVIYTPNLTSDAATGIGAWTPDQFYNAMHKGLGAHGEALYPAFPYPYFTRITREDSDALLAYLKTTPAVNYTAPANRLPFPLNIRFMVNGWNLLFFKPNDFVADSSKSAQWNRGAYIVNGAGHCAQCHTPTNLLGANDNRKPFHGGNLDNWVAPDLTGNPRTGLGGWTSADIVEYLKSGRNAHAQAAGPMAEVVSYSTSLLSDADLAAVAAYLKDLPPSPAGTPPAPDMGAMKRGEAVYSDACASCHLEKGVGQARYFPPLSGDAVLQQSNPAGLAHLILAGVRTAPTTSRPSPLSMPSFAWKLSDQEIADVSTYIRNSWGNHAAPVEAGQVAKMRKALDLQTTHLTVNSGDHF
jgi:mono/diheme cytochrome c family protein